MKKLFLLKLLISVALFGYVLTRIEAAQLLALLASVHLGYLALCLAIYLVSQAISGWRWALLARPLGFHLPLSEYVSFYFIGMFFNLFAPSTVGGDVSRVFYLARHGGPAQGSWGRAAASALVSVIADRAIGLAALVWLAAGALVAFSEYPVPAPIHYLTYAVAVGLVGGWWLLPPLVRLVEKAGMRGGETLRLSVEVYSNRQGIIVQTAAISLVIHLIQAVIQIFVGRALGIELAFSYSLILYPLVGLFAALPISFNGIGLRENGYLFLLGLVGVTSEKAVAFGLLWFVMVMLDSLIGGVVFLLKKSPRPAAV